MVSSTQPELKGLVLLYLEKPTAVPRTRFYHIGIQRREQLTVERENYDKLEPLGAALFV